MISCKADRRCGEAILRFYAGSCYWSLSQVLVSAHDFRVLNVEDHYVLLEVIFRDVCDDGIRDRGASLPD